MTLHILSTASTDATLLEQCCICLRSGDDLLLLGEGVHAAWPGSMAAARLGALPAGVTVHALTEDCEARGLRELAAGCLAIDYEGFVALACAHARSISWY